VLDPGDFELPPIPPKHYFSIGEVSKLCAVEATVLRYWEQAFPRLKPGKRRGNRRSYQRADVKLVRRIRKLLYVDGFTTAGARAQLEREAAARKGGAGAAGLGDDGAKFISQLIDELEEAREMLR